MESTEETPETQSEEDDSIETAESNGTNERRRITGEKLTEEQQDIIFRIKEVVKCRTTGQEKHCHH